MKSLLFALAAVAVAAVGAAGAQPNDELIRKEFAQLVGRWNLVRYEQNGKALGKNEHSLHVLVFEVDDLNKRFRIDPTKTPKWIDEICPCPPQLGPDVLGLYKIEGDRLYCVTTFPFKHLPHVRPIDFTTQPGDHRTLVVFERIK